MFTGIITDLGRVRTIKPEGDARFEFETGLNMADMAIGASVCCSGTCLTVIDKGPGWFAAKVSAETLAKTTLGNWRTGQPVNFERALKAGDELGGHIVTGHVDGVAYLTDKREEGESIRMVFEVPAHLSRFIAAKGSVALDGVSLTVNQVEGRQFGVNLIPHTRRMTTLGGVVAGGAVNLEIDPLARYVARLLEKD
ncbi:MAG: riboflavin synthase [Alphaproteobacteria bacterium]|nr:riboflavin synthase [Alphaproteobacteria bacterium]